MFKIGVIIDFIMEDFRDGVKKAVGLGADGIQFHATNGEMSPENLSKSDRKELRNFIKDNNIVVSAVCADFGGHGFEIEKENKIKIEKSKKILELAKDFDCDIITTHIGTIRTNGLIRENQLKACSELSKFASEYNSTFAIETGPETCLMLKEFIQQVSGKGISVNFDPANLVMVTDDDPVEGVKILKNHITHTHAKDGVMLKKTDPVVIYNYFADGGIEDFNLKEYFREEALGNGSVDFKRYLLALQEIGYDSFLTIERELGDKPLEDIRMSIQYLKKLMKEIGEKNNA